MKTFTFKILMAGDGAVGKTTLLHRYLTDSFLEDTRMTIGVEFRIKRILTEKAEISLTFWDLGGQDQFRFMLEAYVSGASGALLMFDLTRMKTTRSLEDWLAILRKEKTDLPIVLVGTKLDMKGKIAVSDDVIADLMTEQDFAGFRKVSSRTGENVEETFAELIRAVNPGLF